MVLSLGSKRTNYALLSRCTAFKLASLDTAFDRRASAMNSNADLFGLQSEAFFQNPYPVYHQLREQAPVYWCEAWGAWVITRHDDVLEVMRDHKRFSSAGRVTYLLRQLPESARQQVAALERHYEMGLGHSDPPDHTRLRSLLNRDFTPRMVEARRARVTEVADGLIDGVLASGQMDIINDLAYPLPATIIAEMIGAPREDIALFREWAMAINSLFEKGGRISETSAITAQDNLHVMKDYITRLAEMRRSAPQDDLISRLATAEHESDRLTLVELVSTAVTFFVAGHETTTNLIGNGMLALLQHPTQLRHLRDNPSLISAAVEEILRYEPSVPRGWRIATQDVSLRGQVIPQGSLVFPILAAANRDPAHFPDPDRFDIQREGNKQIAFGYGIHFCLGAPLARIEGAVVLTTILKRLPEIQLATDALNWRHDIAIRSLDSLPVRF
jgi:cytochrome P450